MMYLEKELVQHNPCIQCHGSNFMCNDCLSCDVAIILSVTEPYGHMILYHSVSDWPELFPLRLVYHNLFSSCFTLVWQIDSEIVVMNYKHNLSFLISEY